MIEIALLLCLVYAICMSAEDGNNPVLNDAIAEAILGLNLDVLGAVLLTLLGVVPPSALSFFFFTFVLGK